MKKLIGLALTSTFMIAGMVALAGCGSDEAIVIDQTLMGDGSGNKTGLGGYWWTYVDRTGTSSVVPNTGKVAPNDPAARTLNPSIAPGNGIEDDGKGNKAYHVTGSVVPAPDWTATLGTDPTWGDPYVDANYGSLCEGGACQEVKYPAAGIGLGLKQGNEVLGTADAQDKIGIAFKMKVGPGHTGIDDKGAPAFVAISLPMDLTDVPDPSFDDKYGTEFVAGTTPTSGVPAVPGKNTPFCTFPKSINAQGVAVGGANKTCFANLGTKIMPQPTAEWQTYCIAFEAFKPPSWANSALEAAQITSVIKERIIKIQFDAYKPVSHAMNASTAPAAFDFWIDDVRLITAANQAAACGATPLTTANTLLP